MRSPAIAIVIPTRNRRLLLERAISSVLAQTLDDFELIIVDDGSTDGTEDYVLELRHPKIRYIAMREHVGACRARNEGIAASTAPLVTFLDSDDVYLPDRLARVVEEFHRSPHLDLFISSFRTVRRNRTTQCSNPSVQLNRADLEKGLVSHAIFIAGSAITAHRRVLARVGAFDSTLQRMQDRDLLLRLARVTGARLSSRIDWTKYQSPDSISADRHGYVEALAELIARHPVFMEKYPDTTGYLLARHIFKELLIPDPAGLRNALTLAKQYRYFDLGKARVIAAYVIGKRFRRSVRKDIAAHMR